MDEIDRILSRQREIPPSSSFTATVMASVHRASVAPPPIPFPWWRALPVAVAAGLCLTASIAGAFSHDPVATSAGMSLSALLARVPIVAAVPAADAPWLVLALVLSVAPTLWATRAGARR